MQIALFPDPFRPITRDFCPDNTAEYARVGKNTARSSPSAISRSASSRPK